jgi:cytochrome c
MVRFLKVKLAYNMKKIFISTLIIAAIVACGGNEKTSSATPTNTEASNPSVAATGIETHPDFAKGYDIVMGSDCGTCHKPDAKLNGPSYTEIADKYPNEPKIIEGLAEKIIKGGSGVWGQTVMTPHPNLSTDDAIAAVKYVLLFKTKK